MAWVSVVPLWFWLLLGVLYVLAGFGWFWLCGEDRRENDAMAALYGAVWPLTAVLSIGWLGWLKWRKRVNRRKAGWGR